jgi:hypothetical protein
MAPSVLVVLNRSSGVGHAAGLAEEISTALLAGYGGALDVETLVVDDHPQTKQSAAAFVKTAPFPSLVIAAGGGGTLRAAVEGAIESASSMDAVRFAALRMGSGNVVARNLGIPLDPIAGARLVGESLRAGATMPVEVIRCRYGDGGAKVTTGELHPELESAAAALGINFKFLRGDMTGSGLRDSAHRQGPYDVALFIGLSAWLPKPPTIAHLKWLRHNMQQDGLMFTDCFTAAAYAIGGMAMGYRASYYPPQVMASVLEYCGFRHPQIESGANRINHVLVTSPAANK